MKLFIRVLYNALFLFLPVLCAAQHVKRSENIEVIEALSGALLFLEDNQLRYTNPPRKNKGSKYFYNYLIINNKKC